MSPELEKRGGFAQGNSGCWMLKAMEGDRMVLMDIYGISLALSCPFESPDFFSNVSNAWNIS